VLYREAKPPLSLSLFFLKKMSGHINKGLDFLVHLHPLILTAGALAGSWLLTTLGSFPAAVLPISKHVTAVFYAGMAGTMLASATLGMLPEAFIRAKQNHWSERMPWIPVLIGMVAGLALLQGVAIMVALIHEWRKRKRGNFVELTSSGGESAKFVLDETEDDNHTNRKEETTLSDQVKRAREAAQERLQPATAAALETVMPRDQNSESKQRALMRRTIMMISALVLQQIPEGLMLGVSFANAGRMSDTDDKHHAMLVALSGCISVWIGSFPEGMAMMIPLRKAKVHPIRGLAFVQISMMMQTIVGLGGCALATFVTSVLPFALGAVAAAMLFTIGSEIIPEMNKRGSRTLSVSIFMAGIMAMLVLINLFG
jgi:zinc transporter ZupT